MSLVAIILPLPIINELSCPVVLSFGYKPEMVMKGNLTWGGEHTIHCPDDVLSVVPLKPI